MHYQWAFLKLLSVSYHIYFVSEGMWIVNVFMLATKVKNIIQNSKYFRLSAMLIELVKGTLQRGFDSCVRRSHMINQNVAIRSTGKCTTV